MRGYEPAFDMPTTPEEALAWLKKQGEPTCMTFSCSKAARAAELLAGALHQQAGEVIITASVLAELERATCKFPTWPTDPLHAVAVLGEEFGELTKAVLQSVYEPHKVKPGNVREEAMQTAAMALRFLLSLDRYAYVPGFQHVQGDAGETPIPRAPNTLKVRDAVHGTLDVTMVFPGDVVAERRDLNSFAHGVGTSPSVNTSVAQEDAS